MLLEKSVTIMTISKRKRGKAAGPSGIVAEIVKASGIDLVTELANSIVNEGVVPADWEVNSVVNSYYRGLMLLEHVMKVVERIVKRLL